MPHTRSLTFPRACALLLAVVGLSLLGGCPEQVSTTPPRRFEVHAVQTSEGPILVRFDTATGELTQSPLADGRDWAPLGSAFRSQASDRRAGRYVLDYVQSPSIPLTFVRVDVDTGAVWRISHPRSHDWTALQSPAAAPGGDGPAPTVARAPERASARSPARPQRPEPRPTGTDVEAFVEAVTSIDLPSDMRSWAVEQLGKGPTEYAVGPLIELLGDPDPAVVRTAARALPRHDDPRVRPALEQLTKHEVPEVRRTAEMALSELH